MDQLLKALTSTNVENLLLFILPGFVAFKLDQQIRSQAVRSATDAILEIVAYSLVNDILWAPWYKFQSQTGFPTTVAGWWFTLLVVLVSPAILTIVYAWLVNTLANRGIIPSPTSKPWDHFFSRVAKNREVGVILTLKDRSRIAGVYKPPAFASSFPADEQLYLGETWSISADGGFGKLIKASDGLLIDKDDILLLEFYKWPEAAN